MYICLRANCLVMYLCVLSLPQASLSLGWGGPWGPACHHFRPVWAPLSARVGWVQLWTPRRIQACLVWKTKPQVEAVRLKPVICYLLVARESTLWIILQVSDRGLVVRVSICWGRRGGRSQENEERGGVLMYVSGSVGFVTQLQRRLELDPWPKLKSQTLKNLKCYANLVFRNLHGFL